MNTTISVVDYDGRLNKFTRSGGDLYWHCDAWPASTAPMVFDVAAFRSSVRQLGKGAARAADPKCGLRRSNYHMGIPHPVYKDTMVWFSDRAWAALDRLLAIQVRVVSV